MNFSVITLEELSKKVNSAVMWLSKFEPLSRLLLCGKYPRVVYLPFVNNGLILRSIKGFP